MPLISRIRSFLFNRAIRRFRNTNIGKLPGDHFSRIRKIGILFYAHDAKDREVVQAYAKKLRDEGKDVSIMGFFDSKVDDIEFSFEYVDLKRLSFAGIPNTPHAEQFIGTNFDVLINLDTALHGPLNYIAAASRALFKIGPSKGNPQHYDLMVEPQGSDLRTYIEQIRAIFNKITG